MEVTLEKIELVKDRTGVSYKEAKEALEAADGSVVDAIIAIEESYDSKSKNPIPEKGAAVLDAVKALVKKGNVSRIVVRKSDGDVILNVPVNAGIIAALVAPGGTLAATIASFGFKCMVEVIKTDGTIIDVSERANDAARKAREKGSELGEVAKQKGHEVWDKVSESDAFDRVADKVDEAKERTQDVAESVKSKIKRTDADMSENIAEELEKDLADAGEKIKAEVEDRVDENTEEQK